MPQQPALHRGLEERHINLMALGAAVGVGLFLGSAGAIATAGPAILLSYAMAGVAIFFIMRSLGEMAVANPVSGTFSRYAQDYLGPLPGYLTGWTYWFTALVGGMCEITAVGIYMNIWFPHVPLWVWALAALGVVTTVNFIAVKAYGELEFWFALIKVVTIILMILIGAVMIATGLGNGGVATGISNLWTHGGFMPNGISGMLKALPMVMFAYQGIEMLGVTAGEAKDPAKTLSRAVNSVFWRVLIFYVGALFVIMSLYPWDQIGTQGSPFVLTFDRLGIRSAAGVVNFVVLTAALSSCNSNIYGTSRLLNSLAVQQQAPAIFSRISRRGIPTVALLFSSGCALIGVLLNYAAPKEVFVWLTAVSTFGAIWTWCIILLSQYRFRHAQAWGVTGLSFRVPLFPYGSFFAGGFLLLILGLMAFYPETRIAVVVGPIWIMSLVCMYFIIGYHKVNPAYAERAL
ncbi:Proline-specific permease ProY [Paraburkholderia domus]|uniref:amino acid permease n=1 Tax=Paraburkholderia domus TaxID=2793075 RepID=UPI001913E7D6|nr:amino acid permease [Paraburkholderia domus]MBK5091798.1 amino acid permease [Burkholderia sp. R-69927]CAE6942871.1 Proline-specific permease ProY [Paraburkholderia domus]